MNSESHKYDLSICIPAIRPHYWEELYKSMELSCSRYSFEIVFIGPYGLPKSLEDVENVKFIESYRSPTSCTQMGSLECEGRLISIPTDDGVFFEDAYNQSIELYDKSSYKDVIVLRYIEGRNIGTTKTFPLDYWKTQFKEGKNGNNIPKHFYHAMQPLMSIEYFKELGGLDCEFECLAMALYDLSYRAERDGSVFHLSPTDVMHADWFRSTTGDHAPIHHAQKGHDEPLFLKIYRDVEVKNRIKIDFDNWKKYPKIWERRFTDEPAN